LAEIGASVTESSRAIAETVKLSLASIQDIEAIAERSASQAQFTRDQSGKMGMLARQLLERVNFFRLPVLSANLQADDELAMDSIEFESMQIVK
jgi:twitching motility protein PilJ